MCNCLGAGLKVVMTARKYPFACTWLPSSNPPPISSKDTTNKVDNWCKIGRYKHARLNRRHVCKRLLFRLSISSYYMILTNRSKHTNQST